MTPEEKRIIEGIAARQRRLGVVRISKFKRRHDDIVERLIFQGLLERHYEAPPGYSTTEPQMIRLTKSGWAQAGDVPFHLALDAPESPQ